MAHSPQRSLPQQADNWADLKGAYRLLNNPGIEQVAVFTPADDGHITGDRKTPPFAIGTKHDKYSLHTRDPVEMTEVPGAKRWS